MATTWPPRCVSQAWPCPDLELRHDHLTSSDVVALIEDKQKRKSMNPKRKFLPSDCFSSLPTRRSLRSVFCEAITSWLKIELWDASQMLRNCCALLFGENGPSKGPRASEKSRDPTPGNARFVTEPCTAPQIRPNGLQPPSDGLHLIASLLLVAMPL